MGRQLFEVKAGKFTLKNCVLRCILVLSHTLVFWAEISARWM